MHGIPTGDIVIFTLAMLLLLWVFDRE